MKRDIYQALLRWKEEETHRPLLMRGARQIGKTYTITEFGENEFSNLVTLNFERNPEYKDIFSSYDPKEILEKISLFTGQAVVPGKSLLFLDEAQECPRAIISLRYFYEELPALHVVAAGSLLEFALASEDFRMPVGRIQYLFMYPLSFGEFLDAMGEDALRTHVSEVSNLKKLPEALHDKLTELVRKYFILGGMPAVLQEYISTRDILKSQRIQKSLLDTYTDDFAKYAKKSTHDLLKKVFRSIPTLVGQKFVYAKVDSNYKSRDLKLALELLESAGLLYRVKRTSGAGVPLHAGVNESYFKAIFLDIGLFHAVHGIYADTAKAKDLTSVFKGAAAEQFVGQELMLTQSPYSKGSLYYWARDKRGSSAEIDYLVEKDAKIMPIEVKSGATGRMKSLHLFMEAYKVEKGLKISQGAFRDDQPVVSLPFYGIEGWFGDKVDK